MHLFFKLSILPFLILLLESAPSVHARTKDKPSVGRHFPQFFGTYTLLHSRVLIERDENTNVMFTTIPNQVIKLKINHDGDIFKILWNDVQIKATFMFPSDADTSSAKQAFITYVDSDTLGLNIIDRFSKVVLHPVSIHKKQSYYYDREQASYCVVMGLEVFYPKNDQMIYEYYGGNQGAHCDSMAVGVSS